MGTWDWGRVRRNSRRSSTSFSQLPSLPQKAVYDLEVEKRVQGQLADPPVACSNEQWAGRGGNKTSFISFLVVNYQEIERKKLVMHLKICYDRGREEKRVDGVA